MRICEMGKSAVTASFFVLLFGSSSPSVADYRGTAEEQQACTSDALRLCSEFVPDAPRITACLRSHFNDLGPPCHAVFAPDFQTPEQPDNATLPDRKPRRQQR